MQKLLIYAVLLTILLGVGACSTFEEHSVIQTMHRVFPQGPDTERTEFSPPYRYLRVMVGGRVVFMASETSDLDDVSDRTTLWYSGGREVLRFQGGRLVGAVGLATEWRSVVLPALPNWRELATAKEPLRWSRVRDVMPGYRYGIHDTLVLQLIAPPKDSELKGIAPDALTWFEERLDGARADAVLSLAPARYAVDLHGTDGAVVYGEQCVSSELCFSWQHWPVQGESKK